MAYGKRLYMDFDDELGTTWTVEIWDNLFAGAATELDAMGDPPVVIRYNGDKEKVIIGSEATVTIVGTDDFSWIDTSTGDDIKVIIKKAGTTYWTGFGIAGQYVDELKDEKRFLTIVANDRIGMLDKIYYQSQASPPVKYTGYATAIVQIAQALAHTHLGLEIRVCNNLFENRMNTADTDDPFAQMWVNQDIWWDSDLNAGYCADVLEGILKVFDCRIFQSGGHWWVQRKSDMAQEDIDYRHFTSAGVYSYNNHFDATKSTFVFTPTRFCVMADHTLEYLDGWKERLIEVDYGLKNSLITGSWFQDGVVDPDDPTSISGWTNPGGWVRTVNKGFGVLSKITESSTLDPTKYIQSPSVPVQDEFEHLVRINCGHKKVAVLESDIWFNVCFIDGLGATYHWNEGDKEWTFGQPVIYDPPIPTFPYKEITSINFPEVSGPDSLITQEITLGKTPSDGEIYIIINNPHRNLLSTMNDYYYFSGVMIQRLGFDPDTETETDIVAGSKYLITITDEEYLTPEPFQAKISDGLADQSLADYYNGWIKLANGNWSSMWQNKYEWGGDGQPLLISGVDSNAYEGWLPQAWYEQYSTAVKKFRGTIHGHADYFNTLLIEEANGARFLWGDVEYNIKMVEWNGDYYELKDTIPAGTKSSGFKVKTLLWSDEDKRDFANTGGGLILSGKKNYVTKWKSNTEITYSTLQEEPTTNDWVFDAGGARHLYVAKPANLGGDDLHIHAGDGKAQTYSGGKLYLYGGKIPVLGGFHGDTCLAYNGDEQIGQVAVAHDVPESTLDVGGSNGRSIETVSANTSLNETQYVVLVDGTSENVTITLPDAVDCPRRIYGVKAINVANTVKIVSAGGDIDDEPAASGVTFGVAGEIRWVQSNGIKWVTINLNSANTPIKTFKTFAINPEGVSPTYGDMAVIAAYYNDTLNLFVQDGIEIEGDNTTKSLRFNNTVAPQIQSDWNQADSEALDFIKNKPLVFSMVEDIAFEFRDIEPGTEQTYILDLKASFYYEILSCALQSDDTMDNVAIKIGSTAVAGLSAIDVTTAIIDLEATADNQVALDDQVTLVTSGTDGDPTLIRGKLRIQRIPAFS
jgi:hypothetical protein